VASGARFASDQCTLSGGTGNDISLSGSYNVPVYGGPGLQVDGGSATLFRSSCIGGPALANQSILRNGGHGASVTQAGTVRVNGSAADTLQGGIVPLSANCGWAILADAGANISIHGGVALVSCLPGN